MRISDWSSDVCSSDLSRDGKPMAEPVHPVIAVDRVRYVGDQVAMVVADTYRAAQDAAERVEVEYEVLPATASAVAALAPEAPRVWEEASDNLCYDWEIGNKDAVAAAFAGAEHVTRPEFVKDRKSTRLNASH